uniref:Uncharacterized protein n=1 Tax=Sphenodon punctatus TaxID=8508 RepID=A0A8D0L1R4_SPHPU
MHEEHAAFQMNITVFDIALKKTKYKLEILAQQVASFAVPGGSWREQTIMQGYGTETILLGHGSELKLCSVFGTQHETFQDHKNTITSIWVDSFRVVTSSLDLSLRVYTWKKPNKTCSLLSRYQLLGGSHRWSRGFTSVACDNVSIVGVVAGTEGTSILRAYCFSL